MKLLINSYAFTYRKAQRSSVLTVGAALVSAAKPSTERASQREQLVPDGPCFMGFLVSSEGQPADGKSD